ncbi:MAG: hypothetical protein M9921_00615 [Fimbriimonadaceae bacterium]|nr:hypothetical protein [Chthonomonadaceae bacterium]MCO5295336.1 hypothetical protein [Fimbriimonadaceae bacterium]
MKLGNLFVAGLVAATLVGTASAQSVGLGSRSGTKGEIQSFSGVMELTFGMVRRADGTYQSAQGMKVPFHAVRVKASTKPGQVNPHGGPYASAIGYKNDIDGTYFYTGPEFPMPSALDDAVMVSSSNGQPWTNMTVGYHVESTQQVILRWIVHDSFVSGRGAGVSAFSGVLADFGGFYAFPSTGDWKITFDISIAGVIVPDGSFYFASQIRAPVASGEGAFMPQFWTMFSGGGVTSGSSEDLFYYDNDPQPDGIYDETEAENFGGPPGLANLLLVVETGGTISEAFPFNYTILAGQYVDGDFIDLWIVDGSSLKVRQSNASETIYPISVIIEGLSPVANITSLKFNLDAFVNQQGNELKVSLFDYSTNHWVEIARRAAPTTLVPLSWTIGSNPARFVNASTRRMRARFEWRPVAAETTVPLFATIDRATWHVGRP